ncbi:MAG: hypothetical protein RIG67_15450 [Rhodospirillales bacterium]
MERLRRCRSVAAGGIFGLLAAFAAFPGAAADGPPAGIERIEEPLAGYLGSRGRPGAGSVESLAPDFARAGAFRAMLKTALAADWPGLTPAAAAAGYRAVALVEDTGWYLLLDDAGDGLGPTVVLSPAPRRDLIAEAPHPVVDRYTAPETALFITLLGARAAIVAGAHRCAASRESPCSGTTRVCKAHGKAPYRDSDVAHNPDSLFHAAHEELSAHWPGALVFSIHGFAKTKAAPDTWAVISDGGKAEGGPSDRLTRRLRDRLRALLDAGDARAVACDDPDDRRFGFARLCGATNVQGRHLNGSTDVCRQGVEQASGRFLHIEQTLDLRDPFEYGWRAPRDHPAIRAVLDAVGDVVPCLPGRCP